MRIPSPSEIEARYIKAENRLVELLAQTQGFAISFVASLILVSGLIWLVDLKPASSSTLQFDSFYILRTTFHAIIFLVLVSLIGLRFFNLRRDPRFVFVALVLASIVSSWQVAQHLPEPALKLIALSLTPFLCVLSWGFLRLAIEKKAKVESTTSLLVLYSVIFIGLLAAVASLAIKNSNADLFRYFWISKHIFLFITTIIISRNPRATKADPILILNPVHSFRGVLWPEQSNRDEVDDLSYRAIWWRGFSNLVLGLSIYAALVCIVKRDAAPPNLLQNYVDFFLIDIAAFNILTGIARLFGYQIQDATRFVLLSRTPADTWRRGSVYNYIFILRHIYFPVLKLVRSPLLTTLIAFSFFTIAHWGGSFLLILLLPEQFGSEFEVKLAIGRILHALTYALLVFASSRVWFVSGPKLANSSAGQWTSVALTHAVYLTLVYVIYVQILGVLQI